MNILNPLVNAVVKQKERPNRYLKNVYTHIYVNIHISNPLANDPLASAGVKNKKSTRKCLNHLKHANGRELRLSCQEFEFFLL